MAKALSALRCRSFLPWGHTPTPLCTPEEEGWRFDRDRSELARKAAHVAWDGLGRKGIVVIGSRVSKGDSAEPFWVGMEGISWHKGQLAVMALSDGYVFLCKCMFISFFKMQIKHLALHLDLGKKTPHWLNKPLPLLLSWWVPLCQNLFRQCLTCVLHNQVVSDAAGRAEASEEVQDKQHLGSVREDVDPKIALIAVHWFQGGNERAAFELETNPLLNNKCCLPNLDLEG